MNNSSSNSITALVPGGVVTTQNISTVIKPKSNNNSMQFVKIQMPELSKKAAEQIRVAEEGKITKDKIKEVEEEWQSNLRNWKTKRRQQFGYTDDDDEQNNGLSKNGASRNIKTFAEMIEQRAKSGNKLFHLERYIGSGDDGEHGQIDPTALSAAAEAAATAAVKSGDDKSNAAKALSNNNESQDGFDCKTEAVAQELTQKRIDSSDCEAHSSISSTSYNQSNSKSPSSSLDSTADYNTNHQTNMAVKPSEQTIKLCDNNSVDSSLTRDIHSISLVTSSESDQLNSTLKQGVTKMPAPIGPNHVKFKQLLEVDARSNDASSKLGHDSDNYPYEEEEEEDEDQEEVEEQKHLQRIAFVAKLKAFENLTKPSMQEPKFVPSRTVKPCPPLPPPLPKASLKLAPKAPPPAPQPSPTKVSHNYSPPSPPPLSLTKASHDSPPPPPPPPPQSKQQQHHHHNNDNSNSHSHQSFQKQPQELPPSPPQSQLQQQQQHHPLHHQNHQHRHHHQIHSNNNNNDSHHHQNLAKQQLSESPPPLPPTQQRAVSHALNSAGQQHPSPGNKNHSSHQRAGSIPAMQAPPQSLLAPPSASINQRSKSSPREEKDRQVLSVSGKKRCSSCKEELGRGAAAFVVESLSLVYHTNCFRCSVCHVNLSNGFRGVDVRVHAGALHCQNCYSKDGLNYSRV